MIPFIITLSITFLLTYLENNSVIMISNADTSPVHLIIYGLIVGFGTIVPGVSASIILMYLGAYEVVIGAISNLQIVFIFYIGIGFILSVVLFAKLISMLFERAYGFTYYAILGLVLGSIISIFPGFEMSSYYFMNLLILLLCFIASYSLSRYVSSK